MPPNVRFGSEADIRSAKCDVRFTPDSDRKSGHRQNFMSALPPKADVCSALANVGYGPKADIVAHSIISSARACIDGGTLRPSAFAVVRLMINSNLVGCSTGRSAGLAPRRILST